MTVTSENLTKPKYYFLEKGCGIFLNFTSFVGFQVTTAVVMIVAIFWDIVRSPYVSRRFGGTYNLYVQGRKSSDEETKSIRWQGTKPFM